MAVTVLAVVVAVITLSRTVYPPDHDLNLAVEVSLGDTVYFWPTLTVKVAGEGLASIFTPFFFRTIVAPLKAVPVSYFVLTVILERAAASACWPSMSGDSPVAASRSTETITAAVLLLTIWDMSEFGSCLIG